ncbi:MAG: CBS domain-containing protein, partial [Candidatus Latescibacteria bacterium]|nr:CBS domain-containing protein [bacterium]MBD3425095.1 CBS domain-containing protein [Candidatus Latescibacterota bacterium]
VVSRIGGMLFRERLHLITALCLLEIVVIVFCAWMIPPAAAVLFSGAPAGLTVPLMVLVLIAVKITAAGLASGNPERLALLLTYPLAGIYFIFRPLTTIFWRGLNRFFPLLGVELSSPLCIFPDSSENGEGFIEENGSRLVRSIVEFGEKKVREVMVPRIDILALESHMELDRIRKIVLEAGHSRVPVFEGNVDNIIGILFVKDLVTVIGDEESFDLRRILREAYYVPEGKRINDLLREFQLRKKHMAIVVDEYGGTSGIVTLEDILEEIVGEIRDEDDIEGPLIRKVSEGNYSVKGGININDLNEALRLSIPTEEADTLAGFLYSLLGRVPEEGERIDFEGLIFEVELLEGQRITEVRIWFPGHPESAADTGR